MFSAAGWFMQNQPHQAVMGDRDHILKEALVVRNPLLVQMKSSALKVQVKSSEYQDLKPCCLGPCSIVGISHTPGPGPWDPGLLCFQCQVT